MASQKNTRNWLRKQRPSLTDQGALQGAHEQILPLMSAFAFVPLANFF